MGKLLEEKVTTAKGAMMGTEFPSADEVIALWLDYSGERWGHERRERARAHAWPLFLTQLTADELNDGAIQLLGSTQPFTWGFWYRRTRRVAIPRLGPIPAGARIALPAKATPTSGRSPAPASPTAPAGTALQQAKAALEAGDSEQALANAQRAITEAAALPRSLTTEAAAEMVLAAFLADVHDLPGLKNAVSAAERYLENVAPPDSKHRRVLSGHLERIAAAKVNLESGTPSSLTRLCSLLRKPPFRRPDLGVRAAQAALAQTPKNTAALTTQGAALIDLGELHKAEASLATAWDLDGSNPYAAVALCRLHIKAGWNTEALRWGERARELDPNSEPARRMHLAAQLAAGELLGKVDLDSLDDDQAPAVSPFDAVQAAQQLAEEGHTDRACEALASLLELAPDYLPAVRALASLDC